MSKFKTTFYTIETGKIPGLKQPWRLALLADLHNKSYGPDNRLLLEEIRKNHPDGILIAGDLIISDRKKQEVHKDAAYQLLIALAAEYPVYLGNGNHEHRMREFPDSFAGEYDSYIRMLRSCGIHTLVNGHLTQQIGGALVTIYGFELDFSYYKRFTRKPFAVTCLTDALGTPDPGHYNILIAHNPVYFPQYAKWGADLTVSGHLHGGIIRIPGIGGLITPQAKLFPKYDAGYFEEQGRSLIVSRGLGSHTVNLRIFNPAELIFIDITNRQEDNTK